VHDITRVCAALFGVTIIGAGCVTFRDAASCVDLDIYLIMWSYALIAVAIVVVVVVVLCCVLLRVPVFCVIIKNTLFATRACSSQMSFFW
jgi:uncharacterized membrane protein YidH (DUF202 family)